MIFQKDPTYVHQFKKFKGPPPTININIYIYMISLNIIIIYIACTSEEQDGDHCRFSFEVGYLARVYDLKAISRTTLNGKFSL